MTTAERLARLEDTLNSFICFVLREYGAGPRVDPASEHWRQCLVAFSNEIVAERK